MLDALPGDWRFERTIDNGVSVAGVARLAPTVDDGLAYREDGLIGESRHGCPPDIYDSLLVFDGDDSWSLAHEVSGPRKGYRSVTRYARLA